MKIIKFNIVKRIDKMQFSFSMSHYWGIKNLFEDRFHFLYVKKEQTKKGFILSHFFQDELGHTIQLNRYITEKFTSHLILHDMDSIPSCLISLGNIIRLSKKELAFDLTPYDINELLNLKRVLVHKLILNHSRVDAFKLFIDHENPSSLYGSTAYTGNKGDIRYCSKGLKIYCKRENPFVRVEVNLNRSFLKRHPGIEKLSASDFFTIRSDMDERKLVRTLFKKHHPLRHKKYRNYQQSCELMERLIESQVSCLTYQDEQILTVVEQMSCFKKFFKGENLASRVREFFPETGENLQEGEITYDENMF